MRKIITHLRVTSLDKYHIDPAQLRAERATESFRTAKEYVSDDQRLV